MVIQKVLSFLVNLLTSPGTSLPNYWLWIRSASSEYHKNERAYTPLCSASFTHITSVRILLWLCIQILCFFLLLHSIPLYGHTTHCCLSVLLSIIQVASILSSADSHKTSLLTLFKAV